MKQQKTTCENLIKKVIKQENEISDLNNQLKQVKKQLKSTQRDINDQNQYERREMLEVNEIPRLKEENTTTLILQMADKCKVLHTEDDIKHVTEHLPKTQHQLLSNSSIGQKGISLWKQERN